MAKVIASPRPTFAQRAAHLRAFTARALRAMADKVQPVAAESVVVRTSAYTNHTDVVFHGFESFTS